MANVDLIVLNAHFDGETICLDDDYPLSPNSRLLVTVLDEDSTDASDDSALAEAALARAFGDDEPEYNEASMIWANPHYERR